MSRFSDAYKLLKEIDRELEVAQRQIQRVKDFVEEIGPNDPRSGPFVAERVREFIGIALPKPKPREWEPPPRRHIPADKLSDT